MGGKASCAVPPRNGRRWMLYRYRLFLEDGSEAGEADYAVPIRPGETIWTDDGRRLRALDECRRRTRAITSGCPESRRPY